MINNFEKKIKKNSSLFVLRLNLFVRICVVAVNNMQTHVALGPKMRYDFVCVKFSVVVSLTIFNFVHSSGSINTNNLFILNTYNLLNFCQTFLCTLY